jgi:hypothetical protein
MVLLDEISKDSAVCRSPKDVRKDNTILCIYKQYLIPLLILEPGNLDRSYTEGRPPHPSESAPFITAGFIYEYIVIRAEARIARIVYI